MMQQNDTNATSIAPRRRVLVFPAVSSRVWLQHLLAAATLALLLCIFYRDVVFDGRTFLQLSITAGTMPFSAGGGAYGEVTKRSELDGTPADSAAIAWENEPAMRRAGDILKQGQLPLWNNRQGIGDVLMASGTAAPFEPLNIIVALMPNSLWPVAVDIQILLRYYLAGFFTYLFVRQLGVGWVGAVFAGTAYMLTSYFIVYANHHTIRSETLLPLALYCYERLFVRASFARFVAMAFVIAWILLASFPESGFMALALSTAWYCYRLAWRIRDAGLSKRVLWHDGGGVVLVVTAGLGLAAFAFLPLIDHISQSLHAHEGGTGLITLGQDGLLYLLLFRAIPELTGVPHVYGSVFMLAIGGLLYGVRSAQHRRSTVFFAAVAVIFTLKVFDFAFVQWIGLLPGFNQVLLIHYAVPEVVLSVAIVSGVGVDGIQAKYGYLRYALIVFAALFGIFVYCFYHPIGAPFDNAPFMQSFFTAMGAMLSVIVGIVLVGLFKHSLYRNATTLLFVAVMLVEAITWHHDIVRPRRYDPYTPPPFVTYLREQNGDVRVFGFDRIMQPNIASAYGISDIRFLSALVSKARFLFVNQFMTAGTIIPSYVMQNGDYVSLKLAQRVSAILSAPNNDGVPNGSQILNQLAKFEGIEQPLPLGRSFDLLSIAQFLTAGHDPTITSLDLLRMPDASVFTLPPIEDKAFEDDIRASFVLTSTDRIDLPLIVPTGSTSLHFAMALDESAWIQGQTAHYQVFVADQNGQHVVFDRVLDPQRNLAERAWTAAQIDLEPWSGRRVTLSLVQPRDASATAPKDVIHWSRPFLHIQNEPNQWAQERIKQMNAVGLNQSLLEANLDKQNALFNLGVLAIDGVRHNTVFMHANNSARLAVVVPQNGAELRFAIGIDPKVWNGEIVGDGARFRVFAQDGGEEREVFSQYIDPKHHPAERRWIDARASLDAWRGRPITLRFAVNGGPNDDTVSDWAHWGDITLNGAGVGSANPQYARFSLVYDKEIRIYQNNFAYPRAFVVHQAEQAKDSDDAIQRLARADFDPSRAAVVQGALPNDLAATNDLPRASAAQITKETPNSYQITTTLDRPGVLVLSATTDPGWRVYVDGVPRDALTIDVMLQGVALPEGQHTVEFVYQPRSFIIGSIVSIATLLVLCAASMLLFVRKRTRSVKA